MQKSFSLGVLLLSFGNITISMDTPKTQPTGHAQADNTVTPLRLPVSRELLSPRTPFSPDSDFMPKDGTMARTVSNSPLNGSWPNPEDVPELSAFTSRLDPEESARRFQAEQSARQAAAPYNAELQRSQQLLQRLQIRVAAQRKAVAEIDNLIGTQTRNRVTIENAAFSVNQDEFHRRAMLAVHAAKILAEMETHGIDSSDLTWLPHPTSSTSFNRNTFEERLSTF